MAIFSRSVLTIPEGEFTSPEFTVPQQGAKTVAASFTIAAPDISDSTKKIVYVFERKDAQGDWKFDHGFTWQGNTIDPRNSLPMSPSIIVDIGPLAGATCRLRLSLTGSVRLSFDIS